MPSKKSTPTWTRRIWSTPSGKCTSLPLSEIGGRLSFAFGMRGPGAGRGRRGDGLAADLPEGVSFCEGPGFWLVLTGKPAGNQPVFGVPSYFEGSLFTLVGQIPFLGVPYVDTYPLRGAKFQTITHFLLLWL